LSRLRTVFTAADVPDSVRAEIAASLYPKSFRVGTSLMTSVVNGFVLGSVMGSWRLPLVWTIVALLICSVRTRDWVEYQRRPGRYALLVWMRRFTFEFLPFGVWWGTTALLMFVVDDPLVIAIAALSANAQAAGAVCSYPAYPPAALAFIVPAMLIFFVAGLIHGGPLGYSIAFVEIVLFLNYLVIIREFYHSALRGLITGYEKAILADNLAEAHAALQREGRAKSEFLAHMSHELRTPLNAIIGFSDVINSEAFGAIGNPKYQEYMLDIQQSASHLLNIVNEVLDVARIEAGELDVQIVDVDLDYIVQFAARLVRQRAASKQLTFDVDLRADVPADRVLRTDEVRLKQALINLLSNAIKFTEPGGAVRLTAGVAGDDAFFEVRDTGVGMSPEDLERALQPFIQVGSPLVAREGTGLGLPLSRQLVEKLGGRFTIQSTEDVGTVVTIALPLAERIAMER
jgi:signal transduction histidine kinase